MAIVNKGQLAAQRVYENPLDKKIQVNAYVSVGGKEINFVTLHLEQSYGEHHYFEIKIAFDIFLKNFMSDPMDQIDLIGEKVYIEFMHGEDSGSAYIFKGVTTAIEMTGENGEHGYILLKGASPTILLERGKRYDAYSEMTLSQIFNFITETKGSNLLRVLNNPTYESQIAHQMQYNESDWQFIRRMCYQYGVNIFFSGSELLIGDYKKEWEAVPLMYDKDITKIHFCSKLLPNTFTNYSYCPERNDTLERESRKVIENANDFVQKVQEKGELLKTDDYPDLSLDVQNIDVGEMEELVAAKQSRVAAQTVYIKGEGKTFKSTIGRLITVNMPGNMTHINGLGTYRVVKSTHFIDQEHTYHNTFEAVPSKLKAVPFDEPQMPNASSIEATVMDTSDPLGQGRVRVRFPFKTYSMSGWLRVMTPDGGLTSDSSKNRGLLFIPEKDTKVIVNFQMNNPAFPYVAGALFHGNNGQGGGVNNAIKSIVTRSGIKIVFDDSTKSLLIEDGNGCTWQMDGQGNISVKAPKSISLETRDMKISATNNLSIDIGGNLMTNVGKAHNVFANSSKSIISNAYNVFSGNTLFSSKGDMKLQSDSISAVGTQKVTLHSEKMVTANSLGRMMLKSAKAVSLTAKADESETVNHDQISLAVVQFRCKATQHGFYGFDHFNIDEGDTYFRNKNKPFEPNLEGGVLSSTTRNGVTSVNEHPTKTDALTVLKNMYSVLPIIRRTAATAGQETEYFVPRMTIFPSTYDTSKSISPDCAPLSTVTLDAFIEIIEEIDKLEIEFNKTYFDVTMGAALLTEKTPCAKKTIESALTITCKKEFARQEEINVWAYPKRTGAPAPDQDSPKYLAGKLTVYPNDATRRKKQQIVLVRVETNWKNQANPPRKEKGLIARFGDQVLQSALNQSLIEGTILLDPAAADVPQADRAAAKPHFNIDLTRDTEFMMRIVTDSTGRSTARIGKFIYHQSDPNSMVNGRFYGTKIGLFAIKHYPIAGSTDLNLLANKELFVYLRSLFDRKYPKYKGTMAVFCFGEDLDINLGLGGLALGLNCNSAMTFGNNGANVIAHEVYHLLGLAHTFRDRAGKPLLKEQQIIFEKSETNNLMDYGKTIKIAGSEISLPGGEGLWHWQWEKANPRLKI